MTNKLRTTSEILAQARAALWAWVEWESTLLNTDDVWCNGLPAFTQELYDSYCDELQHTRNAAIKAIDDALNGVIGEPRMPLDC